MTRPASATAIQVTTRVDEVTTTGCGSSEPSRTQARIVGNFFRDGPTPSNPFDNTGVVLAVNQIVSRPEFPTGTLVANFFASKCLDFNCDTDVDIGFGGFITVAPKQDVTLGIELDAATNRLIFTKDAETQVIPNVAAFQINTDLQALHFKAIDVRHRLETCPTRAMGFVDVSFTNFRIKP